MTAFKVQPVKAIYIFYVIYENNNDKMIKKMFFSPYNLWEI